MQKIVPRLLHGVLVANELAWSVAHAIQRAAQVEGVYQQSMAFAPKERSYALTGHARQALPDS